MSLTARLSRLEQKRGTCNPLDDLTDEELDFAIEEINLSLAAALGVPSSDMVDIPVDLDEQQLRMLVTSIKGGRHG